MNEKVIPHLKTLLASTKLEVESSTDYQEIEHLMSAIKSLEIALTHLDYFIEDIKKAEYSAKEK